MFEDVPSGLQNGVRELSRKIGEIDPFVVANVLVIGYYLRVNPLDFSLKSLFSRNQRNEDGSVNWEFMARLDSMAEAIFSLRNCSGFLNLCKRLRLRDQRSVFYELRSARIMHGGGFDIIVNDETGVKGNDFDFVASAKGVVINVEVTALSAAKYSKSTLLNALNAKRRQLPRGVPAVIFCTIPEEWFPPEGEIWPFVQDCMDEFFRNTERINAVVIYSEQHHPSKTEVKKGALLFASQVAFNGRARHDPGSLDFLAGRGPSFNSLNDIDIADRRQMEAVLGETEYGQWLKHTLGSP